jgi:adenylyltransferase/sulfurtransferase
MTLNVREELDRTDDRYHRQNLIEWWDQKVVRDARVVVVGAGALGNEILKLLALIGVGRVVVFDMDLIEQSNLSRCVFFRESDEGATKVEVVAERMMELNPDVKVQPHADNILVTTGLGVFAWADVVIGGVDNREARVFINSACARVGRTWVDGAIEGLSGVVRVFDSSKGACYECTMNKTDHKLLSERRSCALVARQVVAQGHVPTSAVSASIIGAMQVQEAIKHIHGQRTLQSEGLHVYGLSSDLSRVRYQRREDCMGHDALGELVPLGVGVTEITLGQLLERAQKKFGEDAVLELSRDVIIRVECASCNTSDRAGVPVWGATEADLRCPKCAETRIPHTASSISSLDKELFDLTPAAIGVPAFDVIVARAGLEKREAWLFDGDADRVLGALTTAPTP